MKNTIFFMAVSIALAFSLFSMFSSENVKSYFLLGKYETLRMDEIAKEMTAWEKEVAPKNKVYYMKPIEPYSLEENEAVKILAQLGDNHEYLFAKIVQLSESGEMINVTEKRKHDIQNFIPFIEAVEKSKCDDEQKQIIRLLACGEFFEYYFSRMGFFHKNNYKFTDQDDKVFKYIVEILDKLTDSPDPLIANISSYLLASYYVLSNQNENAQKAIEKFNKSEYTSFLQNDINGLGRILKNNVARELNKQSKLEFIYTNAEMITEMNKKRDQKIDNDKFDQMQVSFKYKVLDTNGKPLKVYVQSEYINWSGCVERNAGYLEEDSLSEYHVIGKIGLNLKFIKDGYTSQKKSLDFTNLDPSVERHTLDDIIIEMEENGYPKLQTESVPFSFYSNSTGWRTYLNFTIFQKVYQKMDPKAEVTFREDDAWMDPEDFRAKGMTMPNDYMTVKCPIAKDGLIDVAAFKEKRGGNYFYEYPKYYKLVYSGDTDGGFIIYEPKNELNGFDEMNTAPESGYSKELLFKYPAYRKKLYTYLFVKSKNLYGKMRIDSGYGMAISYHIKRKREKEFDKAYMRSVIKMNLDGSRDLRTMPDSMPQPEYDVESLKFFYERQNEEAKSQ